jgi:uncharacterized repeat protein (TIGR01451 family)
VVACLALLLTLGAPSFTAAPPAGTSIGNQASATYTDGSGATRTTTSNPVYTIVQQIGSLTLTAGDTKYATAGSNVSFPHTVTNTGNGTDTFTLAASNVAGDDFQFTSFAVYADANGDGVADNTTPISASVPLASGESFSFVVVGIVPVTAANGNSGKLDITATSQFDGTKTVTKTDTATITSNAVVNVTKAASVSSGASPTTGVTFTLTYKNNGNAAATSVTLTDTLAAGFSYVANSGQWSGSTTALTDAAAGDPAGITYQAAAGVITVVIANVPAGGTGTVSFQVNVDSGLNVGTISNTVPYSYNNGAAVVNGNSNTVTFTVTQTAGVTFTGPVAVAAAEQGATVTFDNLLTNTGNGPDTFNITVGTSTFPTGTTFVLYQGDDKTPLMDTNNDGTPDTGEVAAGGTYHVFIKATLPPSYSGGGAYTVQKKATSVFNPAVNATATDTLTTITQATVDVTNNSAGGPGAGAGPEAGAVTTNATNPGTTTRFTLYVSNTSAIGDTYLLQASTDSTFAAVTLPSGWSVTFRDSAGTILSNSGIIASGANKLVYADVTVADNAAPGTRDIYFRAYSPATGASDRKHDAVSVNTVRGITLTPNNVGQLFAGNSMVYSHTIANTGNVTEGDGAGSTVTLGLANTGTGFTSVIYWDKNNDGTLDPNDPIVTSLADLTGGTNGASTAAGLSLGETATLFVKVYAPAGATAGMTDTATLTATTAGVISTVPAPAAASAKDNSTVIAGDLKVDKWQALDANGDGTPDAAFTTATLNVNPGECIRYKIVLTNLGTANAKNVVLSDATPAYTTYVLGSNDLTLSGKACYTIDGTTFVAATSAPAAGASGSVVVNLGAVELKPNESLTLYFGVKVNN